MEPQNDNEIIIDAAPVYRKCFNHQVLELLSTQNAISATVIQKEFGGCRYSISSVDGSTHSVSLFTDKIWDLILLKLTELVSYNTKRRKFSWRDRKEWDVCLSIHTIAECLNLSTSTAALTRLYDRVVAAANVLRNIKIVVDRDTVIEGYLEFVGVRDASKVEDYITKSNAHFSFIINDSLIDFLETENPGLYHFNHNWLHIPANCLNTYVAAKWFARRYSQKTHNRKQTQDSADIYAHLEIGTLRECLPCLNSKDEKENRVALDNALKSIPGSKYKYYTNSTRLKRYTYITFEELRKLRLRKSKYNKVMAFVAFDKHPNTSDNRVTKKLIRNMNNDAIYVDMGIWNIDDASNLIDHEGRLKNKELKIKGMVLDETESAAPELAAEYDIDFQETHEPFYGFSDYR